jgi:hypothetical protein
MTTPTLHDPALSDALTRQAHRMGHADVDLPDVLAGGTRIRRRRRAFTAAAVGAVAASVVAGASLVPQLIPSGTSENSLVAAESRSGTAAASAPFVYATPTAIHLDGATVELPGTPEQLVQVDSGAVLLSEGQAWWVRAEQEPLQLGSYTPSPIVGGVRAYGDGSQIGWISVLEERSVVQVVDLSSTDLTVVRAELPATTPFPSGSDQTPIPLVLDGDAAYVQDHSGLRRISLSAPDAAPEVLAAPRGEVRLMDAEAGQMLWSEDSRTRVGTTLMVGENVAADMLDAHFSPGGEYVVGFGEGQHSVIEVATGREQVVQVDAHNDSIGATSWIDGRTFIVRAHPDAPLPWQGQPLGSADFYSCVVTDAGKSPACTLLPEVAEQAENVVSATNVE